MIATAVAAGFGLVAASFDAPMPLVTVANAAPVVDAGGDRTVNIGSSLTFQAAFTDAGAGDTHTARSVRKVRTIEK